MESKIRKEIIKRANRTCYICNKKIAKKDIATIDHVIPKSRDELALNKFNMKCCCVHCNSDKSDMTLLEYVQHIRCNKEKYSYISDKRLDYLEEYAVQYEKDFYKFYKTHIDFLGGFK